MVRRLSGYHFDDDSWNYIPVHDPGTGLVDAIVAIAKPDATIGDNLNTVMFIRSGNEFEAWSWRNATRARAVYSAKMILNVSDDDDANWLLEEELPWLDDNALRPPVPYMAGMLTDDPLFEPVMESENPASLVQWLADIGYPVAAMRIGDGGGETEEPCPDSAELRPMAESVEWAIEQPAEDDAASLAVLQQMATYSSTCTGGCTPYTKWINGKVVAGGCIWECVSSSPDVVSATAGARVYNCIYVPKRTFSQTRLREKKDSSCVVTYCSQRRDGFGYGSAASCLFTVTPPWPTVVVCPASPSCLSLPVPSCSSIAPSSWTMWSPPCP